MAWEREGLYLIRDTGPKRFFRIFVIGNQAISRHGKLKKYVLLMLIIKNPI